MEAPGNELLWITDNKDFLKIYGEYYNLGNHQGGVVQYFLKRETPVKQITIKLTALTQ